MTLNESGPKPEAWRRVYPHLTPLVDIGLSRSYIDAYTDDEGAISMAQTLKGIVISVLELSLKDSEFKDPAQKAALGDVIAVRGILAKIRGKEKDPIMERAILYTAITVKMFMTGEPGEEKAYVQLIEEIVADQNPRNN